MKGGGPWTSHRAGKPDCSSAWRRSGRGLEGGGGKWEAEKRQKFLIKKLSGGSLDPEYLGP